MPVKAVMKMLNTFLCLAAFLAVGAISLSAGEELIWAVGKALVSFTACWIVLGWLAGLLLASIETAEPAPDKKPKKASKKKEQTVKEEG